MPTKKNPASGNKNYGKVINESGRSLPPTQKKPSMPKVKPPIQKKNK